MAVPYSPANLSPACLKVSQVLARVGDKWSVMTVMTLKRRSYRFNELRREIEGISQRMLTLTLRNLERDGLVKRTVTPSIPPRVDYELTELGISLSGAVLGLGTWAAQNAAKIDEAQARWDAGI
ncbi:helix-turn-helix domain-containing protein [Rhizobium sp. NFR03]|uniref:winged helix-turn-helix transcriptional regulator n=1 Tax=Rhizobium sp. NFR03 TaxID=1566263 RepID=UPI0008CF6153|nr:helix-turn-helix domain-containing protein [Rhizobium sp. NFR03]SES46723.1 transcriptional regulator, HxlR family [Rhizobium sp. NFR03]